ncbi:MAG: hypothetical protein EOP21_11535 [Hyphomicrobiales bacterium]|nr:MAG: hypothetical protein EOP21_11535 [Hyphomicrobiales bacterium]
MEFSSDDTGLRWMDADIDFQLNWSGVEAVYCTSKAFAFMSGAVALVLPFSAFPDRTAMRSFLEDALARISAEAAETSRKDKNIKALLAS